MVVAMLVLLCLPPLTDQTTSLSGSGSGSGSGEWDIHNLDINDWEISFPSPFPTPFDEHPRLSVAPTYSVMPTTQPSGVPSLDPSSCPSAMPSTTPTGIPTSIPTGIPTSIPSSRPTESPTSDPSTFPTFAPSSTPSLKPTPYPTLFPSLPGHVGSESPTPKPTSAQETLQLEYILFGMVVTLADMMVIAATIWSAVILFIVAFVHRRSLFGDKDAEHFLVDSESSTHTDVSGHSEYRDTPPAKPVEFKSTPFHSTSSLGPPLLSSSISTPLPSPSLPPSSIPSVYTSSESKNGLISLAPRRQSVEAAVAAALTPAPESMTLQTTPIPLLDEELDEPFR